MRFLLQLTRRCTSPDQQEQQHRDLRAALPTIARYPLHHRRGIFLVRIFMCVIGAVPIANASGQIYGPPPPPATHAPMQNGAPYAVAPQAQLPVRMIPPNPVASGPPLPISLAEAVALGLRDNRTIQSAYLQRIVDKYDLFVAADSYFLPRINLVSAFDRVRAAGVSTNTSSVGADGDLRLPIGGTIGFSWVRTDRLGRSSPGSGRTTSVSISQPLLKGAGLDIAGAPVRQARLNEQLNQLQLKSTVISTVSAIIVTYRNLLQSQEQVRLAELSLERTRQLLETNRALIAAGRMAAADIIQTESGVANQEVAVLQAKQQNASAQLALLQLLAVDPRTNIVAADKIAPQHELIDIDQVIALGLATRPDLLSQQIGLEQSRIQLMLARNNRLPDLAVGASYDRRSGRDDVGVPLDSRPGSSVGIRLRMPIGDFSLRQGEISASIALRRAELGYRDALQASETQIRDAVQSVEASWQQLETARRARALAAQALEIQQEKLKVGRASNFEVLSFQNDLRLADTQELSAGIAYLNALTALDQQIGNTLETWRISLND